MFIFSWRRWFSFPKNWLFYKYIFLKRSDPSFNFLLLLGKPPFLFFVRENQFSKKDCMGNSNFLHLWLDDKNLVESFTFNLVLPSVCNQSFESHMHMQVVQTPSVSKLSPTMVGNTGQIWERNQQNLSLKLILKNYFGNLHCLFATLLNKWVLSLK